MDISSASTDIWTIGLIVASVVAGLTLIVGIICLAFYWEERAGSAASKGDTLNSPPLERTEGGDWPTVHGDGSGGAHH
ncbi:MULTISPECIES: hypothetical protein [unclassified Agrobacterium]|uniref:hypothetical protein n=1 Tax=unclassified Agrobacterium TaxID=2632611 RepID=UPI00069965AB|nr:MULTISPECIES: hypothetical protein [unclassified Agrobacterium]KNY32780.1 hypothetical protein AKG12_16725 [Agrobacterium sp. SUL3]MCD4662210.1 hypothetical protein [Agrobacterium sp.]